MKNRLKKMRNFLWGKISGEKTAAANAGKVAADSAAENPADTADAEMRLRKIQAFFANDHFAMSAGVMIDQVSANEIACSMMLDTLHQNAVGGTQGGAIFTLADFTFAVHCNFAMLKGENIGASVGQSCSISYLKPASGTKLTAKSACLSRGKRMSVYQVIVTDERGTAVAVMTGNAFTTNFRPEKLP